MQLPSKIEFVHDGNVLAIDEGSIEESAGDCSAIYIYTKSETKKGQKVELSLSYINRLLGTNISIPKTAKWVSKKSGTSSRVPVKVETKGMTTTELLKITQEKKKTGSKRGAKK